MGFSDEITLILCDYKTDAIGNQFPVTQERTVFADSVGLPQSEYFAAAQQGLRPSGKMLIWQAEYSGETQVRVEKILFDIYRTYPRADGLIELYLKERTCSNGKKG